MKNTRFFNLILMFTTTGSIGVLVDNNHPFIGFGIGISFAIFCSCVIDYYIGGLYIIKNEQ